MPGRYIFGLITSIFITALGGGAAFAAAPTVAWTPTGEKAETLEVSADFLEALRAQLENQAGELERLVAEVAELRERGPRTNAPRKGYDSGWVALAVGERVTLDHNVGGDQSRYLVFFDLRGEEYGHTNLGVGTAYSGGAGYGMDYRELTTSQVDVVHQRADTWVAEFRLRIITY